MTTPLSWHSLCSAFMVTIMSVTLAPSWLPIHGAAPMASGDYTVESSFDTFNANETSAGPNGSMRASGPAGTNHSQPGNRSRARREPNGRRRKMSSAKAKNVTGNRDDGTTGDAGQTSSNTTNTSAGSVPGNNSGPGPTFATFIHDNIGINIDILHFKLVIYSVIIIKSFFRVLTKAIVPNNLRIPSYVKFFVSGKSF